MTTVFYAWPYGRFIEIQSNLSSKKLPISFEGVLQVEIILEPKTNLEEKVNNSILKDDFSSKTDPSSFTLIESKIHIQQNVNGCHKYM